MNRLFYIYLYNRKQLFQNAKFAYFFNRLPWIIIGAGVILRLAQYLSNRSLWLDESFIALNIVNRSFSELLLPLDYNQGAPIGFLMIEKFSEQAFGNNEYALRLFPFFSGILSLFLFYGLAKNYIKSKAIPIALVLFAISSSLIYYSSEVKQYSSDVAIALMLYLTTTRIQSKNTVSQFIIFGIVGAAAIWFSHAALFVLAGAGISLTLFCLKRKEWTRLSKLSVVFFFWALSFVVNYNFINNLIKNEVLSNYWKSAFMPFPPSYSNAEWFISAFSSIFKYPLGLIPENIAIAVFFVGCVSIFSKNKERFLILLSPAFLALLASGFHLYPFSGRFLLFLAPSFLLFIAEGVEWIKNLHRGAGIFFTAMLIFFPLVSASQNLIKPVAIEEIKPVLSYIKEHKREKDYLYLYYSSQPAFKYYAERYGFNNNDYIAGISARENKAYYINDLDNLRGSKRIWILFSHVYDNEEKFFLSYLDSVGTRLDSFNSIGSAAYLYDLN